MPRGLDCAGGCLSPEFKGLHTARAFIVNGFSQRGEIGMHRTRRFHALTMLLVLFAGGMLSRQAAAQTDVAETSGDDADEPLLSDSGVGYIDSAILANRFRFRYDASYNADQPARAEFFWAVNGVSGPGPGPETSIDYQDLMPYFECRFAPNISVFGELPIRFLDPEIQDNTAGLGDSNVGLKASLFSTPDTALTMQLRTYIASGDAARGLGNNHASLEPGLLFFHRCNDLLIFEAELKDWIPIDGTENVAGNVIRYGLGSTLNLLDNGTCRLGGVAEFVGWTVLDGKTVVASDLGGGVINTQLVDAVGDTIINFKGGARLWFNQNHSLYAGYGRALTGDVWYSDTFRIEMMTQF